MCVYIGFSIQLREGNALTGEHDSKYVQWKPLNKEQFGGLIVLSLVERSSLSQR